MAVLSIAKCHISFAISPHRIDFTIIIITLEFHIQDHMLDKGLRMSVSSIIYICMYLYNCIAINDKKWLEYDKIMAVHLIHEVLICILGRSGKS